MTFKRILIGLVALLCGVSAATAQIKTGGAIQITIAGVPAEEQGRFNQLYPVSDNGMINMPFIGLVRAAGLKAEALAAQLQQRYKAAEIYTNPTFQVFDSDQKKIEERLVIVGGYVRRPGPVPYLREMTLWQAVQAAGGPTEFGSMNRVQLTRSGVSTIYDCDKPDEKLARLRPGDSIDVPQKNWIGN